MAPTVFADVDPDSELGQEEVFGPVLAVIPYTDTDDALEIANGTPYGLSGAVWAATDEETAIAFARGVQTGQLDINGGAYNPAAPFGGYKKSGIGRELGRFGFEEYLQTKSASAQGRARDVPAGRPERRTGSGLDDRPARRR